MHPFPNLIDTPNTHATFWMALKATYAGSLLFLVACPLLALVPVVFEFLQHVIEAKLGMFDGIAGARMVEQDPALATVRMIFGFLKVVSLTLPLYWITRFLAFLDPSAAARVGRRALRLFLPVLAIALALAGIQLFLVPQSGWVYGAALVGGHVVNCLLIAWMVAAPLGNEGIGLPSSIAIMGRALPWTFAFTLTAFIPLMIPHIALNSLAIVGPTALRWPLLAVDALLVGWMAAVIVASYFFAASRAVGIAGRTLVPESGAASM